MILVEITFIEQVARMCSGTRTGDMAEQYLKQYREAEETKLAALIAAGNAERDEK